MLKTPKESFYNENKTQCQKKRNKKGSFHDTVTSLVKDGKSFQDIRLEGPQGTYSATCVNTHVTLNRWVVPLKSKALFLCLSFDTGVNISLKWSLKTTNFNLAKYTSNFWVNRAFRTKQLLIKRVSLRIYRSKKKEWRILLAFLQHADLASVCLYLHWRSVQVVGLDCNAEDGVVMYFYWLTGIECIQLLQP